MNILAIETSCDETGVAVLKDGREVLSNLLSTQTELHAPFGGVVPELASRKHLEMVEPLVRASVTEAAISLAQIHGVAVTFGPGLVGALLVGVSFGKALAYALDVPLVAVHHLEGHIHSIFLEKDHPDFPFIALVVSGGHTELYKVERAGKYSLLGRSIDDAAGEAFDKGAKMLNLGYPGGPVIDRLAEGQDPGEIVFPRALLSRNSRDFSFSGLKTSLRNYLEKKSGPADSGRLPRIAAGFQEAIVDVLVKKAIQAALDSRMDRVAVVGGVAANSRLRKRLKEEGKKQGIGIYFPSPRYCTDNGAMIARAAAFRFEKGLYSGPGLNPVGTISLEEVNTD